MSQSFFFYDYETTGIDPKRDRIIQFAGIRTDVNFNIIADPVAEYCKLSKDIIPNLEAILITGIDPYTLEQQGLDEHDFIKIIYSEFSKPGTCVAGYNNIRFDDEFTRYGFYRNFYDPYAREWQNNNSRWDLIDVIRLCAALRPEGLNWPSKPDGKPSFKLEDLTKANSLEHYKAHDALSDVYATIDMAKLIADKQPKLIRYLLSCRKKDFVKKILNTQITDRAIESCLVVHSSRMISSEYYASSIFLPLIKDPLNQNGIICWDLRYNPKDLFNVKNDIDRAQYLLYTSSEDLKDGENRLGLKTIFVNKVPAVAPFSTVDAGSYQRMQLEKKLVLSRAQELVANKHLWYDLLNSLFSRKPEFTSSDAEHMLYDKFIEHQDKQLCARVHLADYHKLKDVEVCFTDLRLKEMLFRYRARNFPSTLDEEERIKWLCYLERRIDNRDGLATVSKADFISKAKDYLNSEQDISADKIKLVKSWLEYYENTEVSLAG